MKPITTLIVDDEQDSRETLRAYIQRYCPQLQIIGECINIEEARASILKEQPQLVFLDIEMPHGNAFDLLEQWGEIDFEVVFVTAFSQYAIQAFNLSAAHYLLKPVDIEALEKAVASVEKSLTQKEKLSHANILLENITAPHAQNRKLVLPLLEGFEVVKMSEVLYCEAEDNFTRFYFIDGRKTLICRHLKFYEEALEDFGFLRVHRSHLINLDYVKRYLKGKGGSVILENGTEILVSPNKKDELLERIKGG
jgi:two-component system, LytTR family, response regulator